MPETSLPEICAELHLRTDGRVPVVNSRDVAANFDKRHDHVLRDIRALLQTSPNLGRSSPEIGPNLDTSLEARGWFRETTYPDDYGRSQPCYDLTRDGFALLVQGFTGEKALQFKIRYIDAFNAMAEVLDSHPTITSHRDFIAALNETYAPMFVRYAEQIELRFDHQDAAIDRIEDKLDQHGEQLDRLGATVEQLSARMDRRRASLKKHEPIWCYVVHKFYGGRCPASGVQILDATGERIKGLSELDHYYEVGVATLENGWLIATEINRGIGNGSIQRQKYEAHFRTFQSHLETALARGEVGRKAQGEVVPFRLKQPSLF